MTPEGAAAGQREHTTQMILLAELMATGHPGRRRPVQAQIDAQYQALTSLRVVSAEEYRAMRPAPGPDACATLPGTACTPTSYPTTSPEPERRHRAVRGSQSGVGGAPCWVSPAGVQGPSFVRSVRVPLTGRCSCGPAGPSHVPRGQPLREGQSTQERPLKDPDLAAAASWAGHGTQSVP